MGTLIAMAYPTKLFANLADHTYVKCGTGARAWSCWGGKTGGAELRRGQGSTRRANAIAQPNERAGIKCYLINGVCHQAANRILLPAGITVRGARGYSVSEALFGTYGRVGFWPCSAPFNQHAGVSGDLPQCLVRGRDVAPPRGRSLALSADHQLDWQYLKGVLELYRGASQTFRTRSAPTAEVASFHQTLFMHMAEFRLGPLLDRPLTSKLKQVRARTEKNLLKLHAARSGDALRTREFVDGFNAETIRFQQEMASVMKPEQYQSLFDLPPGETVLLADPRIVRKAFADR
ncbi:MAG: hypothetical protein HS113_21590 [Verrucomicrobiales bacterium]|nr:hypothetical protein [Verrucomicrobiales bacterium]